ncbi:thiamine phosphate synthase [Synechococcus sp. RSCCF101]|uniref:thiamine phosphate synthase n=1 Tax=Synechococcus sp. RSCCF101 TaxID=2511069 RepID=UPI001243CFAD|nr:thiamine phosphate synthase [Synechococcus sp. RSCCF101]QEY31948.1 thiamine phosphate synthase [Synechococcus sp. RSCCF101]
MAMPSASGQAADESRAILRLIDANLDRAREGLRVVEEWCRFGLERADLVERFKDLRQRLGRCHADRYRLARDTGGDVAAGMGHPAQAARHTARDVVSANCARVQEALRVLEEFGRHGDAALSREAAHCRYSLYDLEIAVLRGGSADPAADPGRRQRLQECALYWVTSPCRDLPTRLESALSAGLRLVQYRCKDGDDGDRLQEALELAALCRRHGALFIVNDRVDLALAVDADGVHLGQGDLPVQAARALLGPDRLIGRSTHAIAQLHQAIADGCDYVGAGPVHATPTKPGRTPVGAGYVREATALSTIPVYAIGGLEAGNLDPLLSNGIRRVAVVRAISEAGDPAAATADLLRRLDASGPVSSLP